MSFSRTCMVLLVSLASLSAQAGALIAWQDGLAGWHGKPLYEFIQASNVKPHRELQTGEGKIQFFQVGKEGYQCSWNLMTDSDGIIVKSSTGDGCYHYCKDVECQKQYQATSYAKEEQVRLQDSLA